MKQLFNFGLLTSTLEAPSTLRHSRAAVGLDKHFPTNIDVGLAVHASLRFITHGGGGEGLNRDDGDGQEVW